MVGCLVAVDVVFMAVWQLVDPLKKEKVQFDLIKSEDEECSALVGFNCNKDDDVQYRPEIWVCRSSYNYVWLGRNH